MFAYCNNNPVNASDPTGYDSSADENGNGIPDYLEARWLSMTLNLKGVSVQVISDSSLAKQYRNEQPSSVVYIVDLRNGDNPDIQVINSYRISNSNLRKDICNYIILYCAANESNNAIAWNRTLSSMETEWEAHNDLYAFYNNERCKHVDFDNADEGVSYWGFIWRAITSVFS